VGRQRLGIVRAAVIIFVSGTAVGVVAAAFLRPVVWSVIATTARNGDRLWENALLLVAINALLGAVGVYIGVRVVGFRIAYGSAAFALALGKGLATVLNLMTLTSHTARGIADPTQIAQPALGVAFVPVQLLLGIFLPAYLIDSAASPMSERATEQPYSPQAPL
jgi:hypothetical protein